MRVYPFNLLLAAVAFAVGGAFFSASPVAAFGDVIGQQQGQQQGQLQGQKQSQANSQTTKFNDERQLAPVYAVAPSFGAAVAGNSCAGTAAWSVGIGGAFFVPNGTGAPVSAGVGFGSSDVVTINLCEVREAANLVAASGDFKLARQIMCQHPAVFRARQAMGDPCTPVAPYKMEVVTEAAAVQVSRGEETASISDARFDN